MHCRSKCPTIYGEDFPHGMPSGFELSGLFLCDTGGLYYDWDGDGIPNWWEARCSPVGDKMSMLANDDSDGDGASNFAEFVAYTDPTNVLSRFIVVIAHSADVCDGGFPSSRRNATMMLRTRLLSEGSGSHFVLRWQSAKGRIYSVYSKHDLSMPWSTTSNAEIEGSGVEVECVPQLSGGEMFFKVMVRFADDY